MKHLTVITLLLSPIAATAGPFVGGGLGYTPLDNRCNEICMRDDLIATGYLGWRWEIAEHHLTHELRAQHYSVPHVRDHGFDVLTWTAEYEW